MSDASAVRDDSGETVEIVVRDRGSRVEGSRGTIVVEDLSDVVSRTLSLTGPNGPNAPITQYILKEAARQLSDRLLGDLSHEWDPEAPKVLSALIGHEPFVERSLNLSAHHMRRRWPMAADWYADLLSYALRPQRYTRNEQDVLSEIPGWLKLPFGGFVRQFAGHQVWATQDAELFRLADTLYTIWPDYEPIQKSYRQYRSVIQGTWSPLYEQLLGLYRLRLRPEVDMAEICWVLDLVVNQIGHEQALNYDKERAGEKASRVILTYINGAVTSEDGAPLTLRELAERKPA